jgi:uncharacterized protein YegL
MTPSRLDQAEFADNPEPRCPVVLLLDTSDSMRGEPIAQLNQGLQQFAQEIKDDPLASLRVEVAVVTFGGAVQALDVRGDGRPIPFDAAAAFVTVDQFAPPALKTSGDTPMGEAMRRALDLLRERKEIYKRASLDYFRPWIFLMTDGQPTDRGWESAADLAQQEETRKGVMVFPVGVEGANLQTLARFAQLPPLMLRGLAFREFFRWLSDSLKAVSQSQPGDQVPLPAATWAVVNTATQ